MLLSWQIRWPFKTGCIYKNPKSNFECVATLLRTLGYHYFYTNIHISENKISAFKVYCNGSYNMKYHRNINCLKVFIIVLEFIQRTYRSINLENCLCPLWPGIELGSSRWLRVGAFSNNIDTNNLADMQACIPIE